MIDNLKKYFKKLLCSHQFGINIQDIQYHIAEETDKTKVICNKCGLVKDYQWVI